MSVKCMWRLAWRGARVAVVLGTLSTLALVSRNAEAQAKPDTAKVAAINAMKGDLRRLVSANEVYHAKHKTYASSISDLPGFKPSPGMTINLSNVSASTWAASETAPLLPGKSCVIYVGKVSPPPKTAGEGVSGPEAVATCDKP